MNSLNPLITKDPVNGDSLIVTRLEGLRSGIVIEGRFSLDWMGRLTPQQLTFVGLLVKHRGNIQRLAAELNVAYNTARNHLDEIVAAIEYSSEEENTSQRLDVLDQLSEGQISFDDAVDLLRE
uniref:Fis family transcriptional regulator n=1 Tax=Thermosporothrix sp. COM3 TaxID=2490863 RepID=A0A455SIN2_9CHLR|nr:Fis family transcriptional regulator [Thermosporothrix sp. COM3]